MEHYEAFMQIVEQGSVAGAARVLGIPRPTVGRRLTKLEERVGERLVQRGARRVVITAAGQALYDRVRGPLSELRAAENAVADRPEAPRGPLRIAIAPLMVPHLTPMLLAFRESHPAVLLEVVTELRFASLTAEGFDVAVRGGVLRDPDLIQRRLRTLQVGLYASPRYLSAAGTPGSPHDLAQHSLLRSHGVHDTARVWWPLRNADRVGVSGAFVTNDRVLLRAAAIAGLGIALLTDVHAAPAVATGELVAVLPDHVGTEIGMHVVYPDRALLPARSRAFIDAVVAFFATWEPLPAPATSPRSGTSHRL